VLVDIRDGHVGGAERLGDLHRQKPDRPGPRDEHAVAPGDACLAARPDADRQRLHERPDIVGHAVGQSEGEVLVDGHEVGEGPVDRRRREERDVDAEVVPAGSALAAAATRDTRLQAHAITDRV
jgi:hypothetical protein